MMDKLIDMTADQVIRRFPAVVQRHLGELTTPQRLELIKENLIKAMPEYKNAILEFTGAVASARQERNDVIHGLWRSTDDPTIKSIVEITHDAPERVKRRVTEKWLMALANRLLDLAIELGDWKMCVNQAGLARSAAAPGMMPPHILRPNPPRVSPKDQRDDRAR